MCVSVYVGTGSRSADPAAPRRDGALSSFYISESPLDGSSPRTRLDSLKPLHLLRGEGGRSKWKEQIFIKLNKVVHVLSKGRVA